MVYSIIRRVHSEASGLDKEKMILLSDIYIFTLIRYYQTYLLDFSSRYSTRFYLFSIDLSSALLILIYLSHDFRSNLSPKKLTKQQNMTTIKVYFSLRNFSLKEFSKSTKRISKVSKQNPVMKASRARGQFESCSFASEFLGHI